VSTSRLAWSLWAVAILLGVPGPVLTTAVDVTAGDVPFLLAFVALELGAATAGAVIASRLPGNAIGWIFLALGTGMALGFAANGWSELAFATDAGPLPLDEIAAWLSNWIFLPLVFGTVVFLLLLFPTGRPLSAAWRRVVVADAILLTVATAAFALKPGTLGPEGHQIPNPLALPGAAGELMETLDAISTALAPLVFAVAIAAMVVRFRRSRGIERQQLKWFALAGAVAVAALAASLLAPSATAADMAILVGLLALAALPATVGMAILRHRLYDVDVAINRTLVYGALTATLAAAYLAGVLLLQLALRPLTEESDLAIAGSTLAVAALFRPARTRIQDTVDRRFYRRKFDVARTLEGFGARVRDQVELDALGAELRAVVSETMQPAHVSLWLRGAPR
jgi:hypothetical protein